MDPVNDTLADEIAHAPPDNPMYAGGIAVLVAFVLFMYWGSLHEKDDQKDEDTNKKKERVPHLFKESEKTYKKKKRKKKRTGVYSVSDAMSKNLPSDTGQEQSCADCEQCQLLKFEKLQSQRTSSSLYGTHLTSKSMQTQNNKDKASQRVARSVSSVRNDDQAHIKLPRRQRAHSSPDLVADTATKNDACTCAPPTQNGGGLASPRRIANWLLPDENKNENKMSLVTFCERDCERTAEISATANGREHDSLHYEQEKERSLTDLEKSYQSAVVPLNGDGAKSNGKVLRQLDGAFVRLESHPGVTIAIMAESVM